MNVYDVLKREWARIAATHAAVADLDRWASLVAERGAKVVIGDLRAEAVRTVAEQIEAAGGSALHDATDVTKPDDVVRLVKLATDHHGHLHVIVNNAGVGPISPLEDLHLDEWNLMIDVNLKPSMVTRSTPAAPLLALTRLYASHTSCFGIVNDLSF
jgi:NAD(P)-dependent dehydrogenase (short-subunit alcohol dehydrogenase family)